MESVLANHELAEKLIKDKELLKKLSLIPNDNSITLKNWINCLFQLHSLTSIAVLFIVIVQLMLAVRMHYAANSLQQLTVYLREMNSQDVGNELYQMNFIDAKIGSAR